jgi:hypothetical protein
VEAARSSNRSKMHHPMLAADFPNSSNPSKSPQ